MLQQIFLFIIKKLADFIYVQKLYLITNRMQFPLRLSIYFIVHDKQYN